MPTKSRVCAWPARRSARDRWQRSVRDGRRATELRQLADEVLGAFPGQVLPFDTAAAALYGDIAAARERGGRPVDALER